MTFCETKDASTWLHPLCETAAYPFEGFAKRTACTPDEASNVADEALATFSGASEEDTAAGTSSAA